VNLNYFISDIVFRFIIDAVDFIAREGWRLLAHYDFDPDTGIWRHRNGLSGVGLSLDDITYCSGKMQYRSHHHTEPESAFAEYLEDAERIVMDMAELAGQSGLPGGVAADALLTRLDDEFESLRWFPLPGEGIEE